MHIVELKGRSIENLIVFHRNHWIASSEVHKAVSQAQSYLRSLDAGARAIEDVRERARPALRHEPGLLHRVVIGHFDHDRSDDLGRDVVARTRRQYNAGLNRVEVVTYDQLVESAERALIVETDSKGAGTGRPMADAQAPEAVDPWGAASTNLGRRAAVLTASQARRMR